MPKALAASATTIPFESEWHWASALRLMKLAATRQRPVVWLVVCYLPLA